MKSALSACLGLACALVLSAGCGKKIGDECRIAFDCQEEDELRTCDISQPGGYCTVDGCDERSCPSEAVCIRFFPRRFLEKPCGAPAAPVCAPDELCLPDGVCAPRSTERRYCALACEDSGDCRDGYECRQAGRDGALALTRDPAAVVRFCAPRIDPR
jgi:hypothetical protein